MILSALTEEQLRSEALSQVSPKWNTLCTLRLIGLSILDAAFVPAGSGPEIARRELDSFISIHNISNVLIRSDSARENKKYFRGGDSVNRERALELAVELLDRGRAIIFMEPTNRFANKLNIALRITYDEQLDIEVLGPGYDISDLNRGGVIPQYLCSINVQSWEEYHTLRPFDVKIRRIDVVDDNQRRLTRLNNIGKYMLPNIGEGLSGVCAQKDSVALAQKWLQKIGCNHLWETSDLILHFRSIQEWYEAAFLTASWYNKLMPWSCLSLTASCLEDGRFVYWDIVNAAAKFDIRVL